MRLRFQTVWLTLAGVAAATAQPNENDELICALSAAPTQLVTGEVDVINGSLAVPQQVYREVASQFPGVDDLRGDEGFFSVTDAGLLPPGYVPPPGSVNISFQFHAFAIDGETRNLWFWDPLADANVSFGAPPAGGTFSFTKSPVAFFTATVDGGAEDVAGFAIDTTSPLGGLHKHLNIVIDDADNNLATPVAPGIYAVAYTLQHPLDPPGPSALIILVVSGGLGAEGECANQRAYDFFQEYLDGTPCAGDIDADNDTDLADFADFQTGFGATSGAGVESGDLDGDCDVDLDDLAVLAANLGPC